MSILGSIMSKVFGHHDAPPTAPSQPATTTATNTGAPTSGEAPPTVPSAPSADTGSGASTSTATPATTPSQTSTSTPAPVGAVDVAAVLDGMEHHGGQTLDWRRSIVDLMKLLGMDSSLTARKALAEELHYTGDTEDSAKMNMWLHKEVMAKFAAAGGKLPADLAH